MIDPVHPRLRSLRLLAVLLAGCTAESAPADPSGPSTGLTALGTTQESGGVDDGAKLDLGGVLLPDGGVPGDCDGLAATIRDFQEAHPDFEDYKGNGASVGLVLPMLGADQTPQLDPAYDGKQMITSAESFAQWYHDVDGVNIAVPIELPLVEDPPGVFVFDSTAFFPLDDQGFGNEDNAHNFHFTTELHTSFTYAGGETFTFRGDDDLWIFVDEQLALDLGGLHSALEGTIEMDTLGLEPGESYPMDIFHAERHTNASNFRIETTIACFVTPPPPG